MICVVAFWRCWTQKWTLTGASPATWRSFPKTSVLMDCIAKWVSLDLLLALIIAQFLTGSIGNDGQMLFLLWCLSELEAALLKELDPQLHSHLVTDNMEKITFCHRWVSIFFLIFFLSFGHFINLSLCLPFRWLLLAFQREFEHSDALRLFEILSCDHLELISQQVDRARYQERLARKYSLGKKP